MFKSKPNNSQNSDNSKLQNLEPNSQNSQNLENSNISMTSSTKNSSNSEQNINQKTDQNPFAKPEILENHFEKDPNYQKNKAKSLQNFLTNYKTKFQTKTSNFKTNPQNKKVFFPIFMTNFSIFTNPFQTIFQNPIFKFAASVFVVFCVSFTTIFTGILAYSQTLPEKDPSSIQSEISKNLQNTDQCKNFKVEYKGDLDVWKKNWDQKFQDKTFYYNSLSITEKKNINTETTNFDKNGFLVKQYDFSIQCQGKFNKLLGSKDWEEFYDKSVNVKKPEALEYLKCFGKRLWKWREDQREVYCRTVDSQRKTTQIHIDDVPFLSNQFRNKIQKDKIFKIDGGFLGNNYFRNSNSTIYFVDENNTLYSLVLYPETAEYFARNYNLIIDLE